MRISAPLDIRFGDVDTEFGTVGINSIVGRTPSEHMRSSYADITAMPRATPHPANDTNVQTQEPSLIAGTAERGMPPMQPTTMAQAAGLSAPKFRPLFDKASY